MQTGEEVFDCVVVCVDHCSGYILAVPARKKGSLAKDVAVMMVNHSLTGLGIPRSTYSDHGIQFKSRWFEGMCSVMAMRQAKGLPYLRQSNGRAKVAWPQLLEKLRKIHLANKHRNWFEEMWRALKGHQDTLIPVGLSPHLNFFGKDPLAYGFPSLTEGMSMDARGFFVRQATTVWQFRQQITKEHLVRVNIALKSTAQTFSVGDGAWELRPRPTGTHRTKTSLTAGEVVRAIGEDIYRVRIGPRQFRERLQSQLCAPEADTQAEHMWLDYAGHFI